VSAPEGIHVNGPCMTGQTSFNFLIMMGVALVTKSIIGKSGKG